MLSFSTNLAAHTVIPTVPEPKKVNAEDDNSVVPVAAESKPGVAVTISGAAMKAAAAENASNNDIDDSGLADNVKQLLKLIRQIKQQIAEKQAEMAAVMADKNLSPEQAQARLGSLQSAISTLQAGLTAAQASLLKAMKDMSSDDAMKTASLAMK
ncbi:hypothetical protein GNF76_10205 [Pseudomonas sp. CCM 7893]|uniref:Chemotaxis protein n=1 Tax=Pseudomonas spelaei TaxID=1055469 RepID=A0A6I3WC01_9PSED|nr:hypothetical protein [Pseudomonas spelaei]MUF04709.1 hypothetical protein [Pseudomonas spelaei]